MKTLKVKLTFQEPILGTSPADEEIYRRFIAIHAPDFPTMEEEVKAIGVDGVVEKGLTIFPRDEDGRPILYDYQIKGFFKDACSMLSRVAEKDPVTKKKKPCNESSKITAHKKVIDGLIFVLPKKLPIITDSEVGYCQRPLRAQTAQGERVALAISESIDEGATVEFTVKCLSDEHMEAVKEWLDYGELRGIGQWRNSGKGRFTWEEIS